MTPLEAKKQLARVDAGGRVSQDVAIAALNDVEGLRYQYAAQVWRPLLEKWLFVGTAGLWRSPHRARWYMLPATAEEKAVDKYPDQRVRVVARAYSQPILVGETA